MVVSVIGRLSQSAVKSSDARVIHWVVVGVFCVLSLARRLAVNLFCRLCQYVELVLRRQQLVIKRSSLVAGLLVTGIVIAVAAAVVYGVGLYYWHRLIATA